MPSPAAAGALVKKAPAQGQHHADSQAESSHQPAGPLQAVPHSHACAAAPAAAKQSQQHGLARPPVQQGAAPQPARRAAPAQSGDSQVASGAVHKAVADVSRLLHTATPPAAAEAGGNAVRSQLHRRSPAAGQQPKRGASGRAQTQAVQTAASSDPELPNCAQVDGTAAEPSMRSAAAAVQAAKRRKVAPATAQQAAVPSVQPQTQPSEQQPASGSEQPPAQPSQPAEAVPTPTTAAQRANRRPALSVRLAGFSVPGHISQAARAPAQRASRKAKRSQQKPKPSARHPASQPAEPLAQPSPGQLVEPGNGPVPATSRPHANPLPAVQQAAAHAPPLHWGCSAGPDTALAQAQSAAWLAAHPELSAQPVQAHSELPDGGMRLSRPAAPVLGPAAQPAWHLPQQQPTDAAWQLHANGTALPFSQLLDSAAIHTDLPPPLPPYLPAQVGSAARLHSSTCLATRTLAHARRTLPALCSGTHASSVPCTSSGWQALASIGVLSASGWHKFCVSGLGMCSTSSAAAPVQLLGLMPGPMPAGTAGCLPASCTAQAAAEGAAPGPAAEPSLWACAAGHHAPGDWLTQPGHPESRCVASSRLRLQQLLCKLLSQAAFDAISCTRQGTRHTCPSQPSAAGSSHKMPDQHAMCAEQSQPGALPQRTSLSRGCCAGLPGCEALPPAAGMIWPGSQGRLTADHSDAMVEEADTHSPPTSLGPLQIAPDLPAPAAEAAGAAAHRLARAAHASAAAAAAAQGAGLARTVQLYAPHTARTAPHRGARMAVSPAHQQAALHQHAQQAAAHTSELPIALHWWADTLRQMPAYKAAQMPVSQPAQQAIAQQEGPQPITQQPLPASPPSPSSRPGSRQAAQACASRTGLLPVAAPAALQAAVQASADPLQPVPTPCEPPQLAVPETAQAPAASAAAQSIRMIRPVRKLANKPPVRHQTPGASPVLRCFILPLEVCW